VAAALQREELLPIFCLEPASGEKPGCPARPQPNLRHLHMAGSHHFGGDYATLAETIQKFMREVEGKRR